MTATSPLLLLDVDGVLNVISKFPDRSVWPRWERGTADGDGKTWPILFSPDVTEQLAAWSASGDLEIRWLTTWGNAANEQLSGLLGLPQLVVQAEQPAHVIASTGGWDALDEHPVHAAYAGAAAKDPLTGQWWKFDAVRELLLAEPGRKLIWADDDLRVEFEVVRWMRAQTHAVLLSPHERLGLTPKMIRLIGETIAASKIGSAGEPSGQPR